MIDILITLTRRCKIPIRKVKCCVTKVGSEGVWKGILVPDLEAGGAS